MEFLERIADALRPLMHEQSWLGGKARQTYRALFARIYGDTGVRRTIHGEQPLRFRASYARSVPEDKNPGGFRAMKEIVNPGDIIFDVGANVGMYSLLLARWCGPNGRIHAFEPTPEICQARRDHARLNELHSRIVVVQCALSDQSGTHQFYVGPALGLNSVFASGDATHSIEVPAISVDDYCRSHGLRPNFLKVDVEGFELQVLQGASTTIAGCRPHIPVEPHPSRWSAGAVTGDQLALHLESLVLLGHSPDRVDGPMDPLDVGGYLFLRRLPK